MQAFRWLHLSDFHVGKDNYGQRQLFKYILDHAKRRLEKEDPPHCVFLTGDIANSGKSEEYEQFFELFLTPLQELLPEAKVYSVPGNHDVDRNEAEAVQRYKVLSQIPRFLDPDATGLKKRSCLLPRFFSYASNDTTCSREHWILSEKGYFSDIFEIDGVCVGIVGINTAWLCEGDADRHELTPGKSIVETALAGLDKCDLRLVLGHHPLDWMHDLECKALKSLFDKHRIIYLHGHLHQNEISRSNSLGGGFLSIQAGSCFQARENEIWANRLLWGAFDLRGQTIYLEPFKWSCTHQDWCIDADAFSPGAKVEGKDRWKIRFAKAGTHPEVHIGPNKAESTRGRRAAPESNGWCTLTKDFLVRSRADVNEERLIRFFDGKSPDWSDALNPRVCERSIVHQIYTRLTDDSRTNRASMNLIVGPGGEGKSTVIRQIAAKLVDLGVRVLWRENADAKFLPELILRNNSEKYTVFVSDDADLIAKDLLTAIESTKTKNINKVAFLVSARDTDWIAIGANTWPWATHIAFRETRMRGLSLEDARSIMRAWSALGERGLGKLAGLPFEDAARKLAAEAKREEESSEQEGALLGAMLRTRIAEGLNDHVLELLIRLNRRKCLPSATLLETFAYIAALHSENLLILSRQVLASVLNCREGDLRAQVLGPLGDEAALSTGGQSITTRHRAIAEAAVMLMAQKFNIDFDRIFSDLVAAAVKVKQETGFLIALDKYEQLGRRFFNKGKKELGIRIAQSLCRSAPQNSWYVVNLASLYRDIQQHAASANVFRNAPKDVTADRTFFLVWASAERSCGNFALAACLAGVAVIDQLPGKSVTNDWGRDALILLTQMFGQLHKDHNDPVFLHAAHCSAYLSPRLKLDPVHRDAIAKYITDLPKPSELISTHNSLECIAKGLQLAFEMKELALPSWVPDLRRTTMGRFRRLLIPEEATQRSGTE
jgi:predicted phosphodiesterase